VSPGFNEEKLRWLANNATILLNVSGGKDSAVASVYATKILRSLNPEARIYVIYAHTPLALEENLSYVKSLAEFLGAQLLVARPSEGLEALVHYGLPSFKRRWCMDLWKLKPMETLATKLPQPHLNVVGLRTKESRRRMAIFSNLSSKDPWFFCRRSGYCSYYWAPILDWDEEQVWEYIEKENIPRNPLWRKEGHSSHDCVICLVWAGWSDYMWLKNTYPSKWSELIKAYRLMNERRRRKKKILAWHYVDLDEVDKSPTLLDFMSKKAKCETCGLRISGVEI
jgi:3'-phosphoadenosine 5'-phosphosulfate sulfotransferase (PAPS reductase)/FAD synthetase